MERTYQLEKSNSEIMPIDIDDQATLNDVVEQLIHIPGCLGDLPPGHFRCLAIKHGGRYKMLTQDESQTNRPFSELEIPDGATIAIVTNPQGAGNIALPFSSLA